MEPRSVPRSTGSRLRAETEQMLKTEIDTALTQGRLLPIVAGLRPWASAGRHPDLNRGGYHLLTEPVVKQYCDVYESFGVKLGPLESSEDPGPPALRVRKGVDRVGSTATFRKVTDVIPPAARSSFPAGGIDPRARYRYGVDVVIPLSDHADFYDLVE